MLQVTSPALEKIKEVLAEQGEDGSALRVIAVPAGHGGVQYMMTMESEVQKDDTTVDMDGVRFLMDSDSEPFLEGATIDYIEDLTRVGFVINNPMFASAGGCGSGCGCGAGGGGCGGGGCGGH
ncbi:MAG: iron-sulfur cluster assembly accessory protein [Dehalococcoidia bacterium]|nr:iron-sulfur cluster assembly accessory protein [Dehalococcoidia bacterium]